MARPPRTISLAELALLIRARAGTILLVALAVTGAALAVGYRSALVFAARGQIFLGEATPADVVAAGREEEGISSEIAILGGASLLEHATLAAGLNAEIGPERGRAPRYSEWLAAGRDYAALERPDSELAIAFATIAGSQPERFEIEMLDAGRYRVWSGGQSLGEGRLGEPWRAGDVAWTLLEGPVRAPRPGARHELVVGPAPVAAIKAGERLRISAPRGRGSAYHGRIVTLEFSTGSPHRAQRFLAALIDGFLEHRHDRKIAKLLAREAYLEGEARSVERALDGIERRLAELPVVSRGLWLGDDADPLTSERQRYEAAESRSLLELAQLSVYEQGLSGPAPPLATFLAGESNDAQLEALSEALAQAERELTDARERFTGDAPELAEQEAKLRDRQRAIQAYVEGRVERARQRRERIAGLISAHDRKLDALEQARRSAAELERDRETYAETYTRLLSQKGEASLVIAKAVSKDRVIDPPRAVAEPASPSVREALSSGLFGVLLGVLGVLFRRLTASSVQAESDVRRSLGGAPVLGIIPRRAQREPRRAALGDVFAQARAPGRSPCDEAFRLLGMTLLGAHVEPSQQVVFITSPGAGDGKTSSALALGLALARHGRRVLIVDGGPAAAPVDAGVDAEADARAGASGEAPGRLGLADVLAGRSHLRRARTVVPSVAGELHLLGPGRLLPDEPSARSGELVEFLAVARGRYDAVLVDVPAHVPAQVFDAIEVADRVLCVVRIGHTRCRDLEELLTRVPRARLAAVLIEGRAPASVSAPAWLMPELSGGALASRG